MFIAIFLTTGSTTGLLILILKLVKTINHAPCLRKGLKEINYPLEKQLTVIIPTYNEASNIEACLKSILENEDPCKEWDIIIIDDCSTDETVKIALDISEKVHKNNSQIKVLSAGPRPKKERWVGKNWACSKAMEKVKTPWVLFIDADVRLEKRTLKRSLEQAFEEKADLLSLAPRINCGCLSEWMVQPIMASLLILGFPILDTNDPKKETAFAAGPFMLFRKSAYKSIGGHKALAGEVVEDLALAKKIKTSGFKLIFLLGLDAIQLRMYSNITALIEGWSKNWFIGLDRNIIKSLGASLIVVWLFSTPWLFLSFCLIYPSVVNTGSILFLFILVFSITSIFLQYFLRLWIFERFKQPLNYWWLMGIGGLLIGIIGPLSTWKTITGRGWTWKGRSLKK